VSRRLDDVRLAVMMIDGLELQGRTNVVALGITTEGVKIPLALWEGSTENATVATALLSDLVERGLDPEQGILFVIDGAKALRKAIRNVFGEALAQRCVRHKERNVLDHMPERDRPAVKQRLRRAWALDDHARALDQLRQLAGELERTYPGAAGSLHEGMDETLTLSRLGVTGNLKRTLESTNPCESMLEIVRRTQRNVKRWSSGEMALRWTAAGMLEAERQFRKIIGYRDLALVVAIEHDLDRSPSLRYRSHPDQGGRHRPQRLTTTPAPPPRSFASRTTSVCFPGRSYFDANGDSRASANEGRNDAALSIEVQLHAGNVGQADRQSRGPPEGRSVVHRIGWWQAPRVLVRLRHTRRLQPMGGPRQRVHGGGCARDQWRRCA
jgi:hypothetical protein